MKKTILKLILAFIFAFGTYFYFSPTEAKAVSVDDITSVDDLMNTTWVLKEKLERGNFSSGYIYKTTSSTSSYVNYTFNGSEVIYGATAGSGSTPIYQLVFSFLYSELSINYISDEGYNDSYIIARSSGDSFNYLDNYGIAPRILTFGEWEPGEVLYSDSTTEGKTFNDFINFLKNNSVSEPTITFNLDGGTTAESLEDITYTGSYTINPDELPTPTYEYMSNNVWLTEQIEYSNYFRGWAYSTDDGDTYYWFNDGVPHTFTDEDVIIRAYWEEINWVPIKIFTQSVEPSNDLIVFATPYLDDTLTISIDFTLYSNVKLTISGYRAPPYSYIASDRFDEVVSVTNNDTSTIIELKLLGTDIDYMVLDKYDGAELTELLNITEEEMSELKYGSSSKTITFDVDLTTKGNDTIITAYIIPESSVVITPPEDNWVINAFGTFFLLIESILNLQLGFITLGHIIGLLLSIAVIGFIFKVWNGANNG